METVLKARCATLVSLLEAHGIEYAVVSPGTRNAPLLVAANRSKRITTVYIVDERVAGFVALGISLTTGRPVALMCTSGTAMLNYAPALAEAYYRRVPLVAVSADRPYWWIDQRDSQTIRQANALDAFVRKSVDILPESNLEDEARNANRLINEALTAASGPIPGPVHINIQFDAPLNKPLASDSIKKARPMTVLRSEEAPDLSGLASDVFGGNKRVLVLAGGLARNSELARLLTSLSDNYMVIAESQSNLPECTQCGVVERSLDMLELPDVLVSIGGSLVSARIKSWLRKAENLTHISVGYDDNFNDTFGALCCNVECAPESFFKALIPLLGSSETNYCQSFKEAVLHGEQRKIDLSMHTDSPYYALNSINIALRDMQSVILHIGNGSIIRYAQAFNWGHAVVESNRGVSGIDGCTSTAIGASLATEKPVVLLTGDMSAAYDISSLAVRSVKSNFKMIVFDNDGGDIFRNISATRDFDERESMFCAMPKFPLAELAMAYGFEYRAGDVRDIHPCVVGDFLSLERAAILHIKVNPADSANLL